MAGKPKEKWSQDVTENSDALDLEAHVFEQHDPHKIAVSLKRRTGENQVLTGPRCRC